MSQRGFPSLKEVLSFSLFLNPLLIKSSIQRITCCLSISPLSVYFYPEGRLKQNSLLYSPESSPYCSFSFSRRKTTVSTLYSTVFCNIAFLKNPSLDLAIINLPFLQNLYYSRNAEGTPRVCFSYVLLHVHKM